MSKQEKIREGLKTFFKEWDESGMITFDCECAECISDRDIFINALCEYQHSQGLVLKVDREEPQGCSIVPKTNAVCPYKEAGYVAVESLIT